jgi:hypothetical protein
MTFDINTSGRRTILGVIPDSKLNIKISNSNITNDININKKSINSNTQKTPIKSKFDDIVNNYSVNNPMKRSISNRETLTFSNSLTNISPTYPTHSSSDTELSPKLKRARLLKMKLKLAYFKVKTNQTATSLTNLKLPNNDNNYIDSNSRKNIFNKSKVSNLSLNLKNSSMDDIVRKKGTSENLKRFNLEYNNIDHNKTHQSIKSAPSNILSFSQLNYQNRNSSSVTSPSKFAMSTVDKQSVKLPPVSKIFNFASSSSSSTTAVTTTNQEEIETNSNPFTSSKSLAIPSKLNKLNKPNKSNNSIHINNSFNSINADLTIEEKETNETTILQNETTNTSTPIFNRNAQNLEHLEKNNNSDFTLFQNSALLMSTPVRKPLTNNKKQLRRNNSKTLNSTTPIHSSNLNTSLNNGIKINRSNSILKDEDETQLMSSPTKLLSTPSSIGAAKCLLQLAHR